MEERTLEEILTQFVSSFQDEAEHKFTQGALAEVLTVHGMSIEELANNANCSGALIRELIKTFRAFPTEEERLPYAELTHYHFRLAAGTDDPHKWMKLAADHNWSTRELREAISGKKIKDELREAQKAWAKVEKVLEAKDEGSAWIKKQIINAAGYIAGGASMTGGDTDRSYPYSQAGEEEETETVGL